MPEITVVIPSYSDVDKSHAVDVLWSRIYRDPLLRNIEILSIDMDLTDREDPDVKFHMGDFYHTIDLTDMVFWKATVVIGELPSS